MPNTTTLSPVIQDNNDGTLTIPAGTYAAGDPGYVIPDDYWPNWLDSRNSSAAIAAPLPDGGVAIAFATAHGDGVYSDQHGNDYPVDAGLIGLVSIDSVDGFRDDLSRIVTFPAPVRCSVDNTDGAHIIILGDIRIPTSTSTDEEGTQCCLCGDDLPAGAFEEYCENCQGPDECAGCGIDLADDSYGECGDLCDECADDE